MTPLRGRGLAAVVIAVLVMLLAACGAGATTAPTTESTGTPGVTAAPTATPVPVELTIFGAASLKDALEAVKSAYEAAVPGLTLMISTDSSAALETQIEEGAPADVFLSADTKNPQKLADAGLAGGDLVAFAGNLLVIIVPADNPAAIQSPADLATPGVKIIAAGDEVPITKYATQLLTNLAAVPGYPADFAAAYAANVVSREDNVKAEVTKIELGEGDAAIVYVTDASASTDVATIEITPASANVPATYAGVTVKASAHPAEAAAFLEWLAGPDGRAILADFGFLPPS